MDWYELSEIIDYLTSSYYDIDKIIELCEGYLDNKEKHYESLKKLQEIKKIYQKGLKFTPLKMNKRKPDAYFASIETIANAFKKGLWPIETVKDFIELEKKHIKSKTTLWRFKKRLLDAGIPQNLIV